MQKTKQTKRPDEPGMSSSSQEGKRRMEETELGSIGDVMARGKNDPIYFERRTVFVLRFDV